MILSKNFIIAGTCMFLFWQLNAFDIVKNGTPAAKIVIKNTPSEMEMIPAKTFQEYIRKITGANLEILEEKKIKPSDSNFIIIGDCEILRKQNIDMSVLKRDGYYIISKPKYLILAGRNKCDPSAGKNIDFMMMNNVWGTLNSVNVFLEDYAGVRWFMPGSDGEVFKKTPTLSVPDNINRVETPFFWWALGSYSNTSFGGDTSWSRRNSFRKGILCPSIPGSSIFHSWKVLLPAEEYFKEHPEYFRMLPDGSRSSFENMICTSNKDVQKIASEKIKKIFDKGYEVMVLGQSDGCIRCLCPKCEALDEYREQNGIGTGIKDIPCDRIHSFNYEIINSLSKSYPSNFIMISSYGPTLYPSNKINNYPENIICNLAPITPENLKNWKDKSKIKTFSCWFYWWHVKGGDRTNLFPIYSPYKVADEIKEATKSGIKCATFCFGGENFGNEGPSYYVLGRLLRNPDVNIQPILNEYYHLFYENASDIMREYFETLYPMMDKAVDVKQESNKIIYFDNLCAAYPAEQLEKCSKLLEKACANTQDKKIQNRISLSEYNLKYTIYTIDCYAKYKTYRKNPSLDNFNNLESSVKKREDYIAALFSPEEQKKQEGLPAPFNTFGKNGKNAILYGPKNELAIPFKIDFQKLKDKKDFFKIPEAVIKKMNSDSSADNRQEKSWIKSAMELTMVNQTDLSPATPQTTAKITYDDSNIYFAVKCNEPEIQNMKMPYKQRDDSVWDLNCIELFIVPHQDGDSYFHFIAAPSSSGAVSIFDAKKNGSSEDLSFSPEWKASCIVDSENKNWTMEIKIPFSSMGIKQPIPGEKWRIGLYRSRFINGRCEFMAWSPTLCPQYAVPSRFGCIVFK